MRVRVLPPPLSRGGGYWFSLAFVRFPERLGVGVREGRLPQLRGGLAWRLRPQPCPPALGRVGCRLPGQLQREGRHGGWTRSGATSYLVNVPAPFCPGLHASFAGRKRNRPAVPQIPLKRCLYQKREPFTFEGRTVSLLSRDFSVFTCRNTHVEAFPGTRNFAAGESCSPPAPRLFLEKRTQTCKNHVRGCT